MNRARLLLAGLAAAVLAPAAIPCTAMAQVDPGFSQSVVMDGDVPTRCRMSTPQAVGAATNATFTPNTNGGRLDLTQMVDAAEAKTIATHGVLEFPIICTGAHSLTVTSTHGGLVNASATGQAGGFATRADYTLSATWAGTTQQVQTGGSSTALDLSQQGPAAGALSLDFNLPGGSGPLQAGAYSDEIVVQLNAAS
jgi:hypothetical protein